MVYMLLAAAVLLFSAAAAEEAPLFQEQGLAITLVSFETAEGEVSLKLQCTNQDAADRAILLFAPQINGLPASFRYGWPTEEIVLAPQEQREAEILVYSDNPRELPDSLSFRLIDSSSISSEACIDLHQACVSRTATFSWAGQEPAVIAPDILRAGDACAAPMLLTDTLLPSQLPLLDYGQLRVCLRIVVDGEERLIPFTTIRATVDENGSVSASYSGNAVVCDLAPRFPMRTVEIPHADGRTWQISHLSLSGLFVFHSTLTLTLEESAAPETRIAQLALESFDTGSLNGQIPLALFDTLQIYHPVYRTAITNGVMQLTEVDSANQSLSVSASLPLSIVPAGSLGEVVAYFEYFFTDYTDVIHPWFPLYP